jgi:hypothetical protein
MKKVMITQGTLLFTYIEGDDVEQSTHRMWHVKHKWNSCELHRVHLSSVVTYCDSVHIQKLGDLEDTTCTHYNETLSEVHTDVVLHTFLNQL